jgi:hypothetical protein
MKKKQLVSMKLPPAKPSKEALMYPSMAEKPPEYPYGLRIRLEDAQLDKLSIVALPKVGTRLTITADVEVCSVSAYESNTGSEQRSLELQITDLGYGSAAGSAAGTDNDT